MSDSRPGSKTYKRALQYRFRSPPRIKTCGSGMWECNGGTLVVGVGDTPQSAYVDHVEEAWCFSGDFPEGYPN